MSGHLKELLAGEAACPGDPLRNVLPQRFWMLGIGLANGCLEGVLLVTGFYLKKIPYV